MRRSVREATIDFLCWLHWLGFGLGFGLQELSLGKRHIQYVCAFRMLLAYRHKASSPIKVFLLAQFIQ